MPRDIEISEPVIFFTAVHITLFLPIQNVAAILRSIFGISLHITFHLLYICVLCVVIIFSASSMVLVLHNGRIFAAYLHVKGCFTTRALSPHPSCYSLLSLHAFFSLSLILSTLLLLSSSSVSFLFLSVLYS